MDSSHQDLADILGQNWPKHAGPAAMILNKPRMAAESSISEDIKHYKDVVKPASPISIKIAPEEPPQREYLYKMNTHTLISTSNISSIEPLGIWEYLKLLVATHSVKILVRKVASCTYLVLLVNKLINLNWLAVQ